MNDARSTEGPEPNGQGAEQGSVPNQTAHLSEWTLEQLAEEMLSPLEQERALAHVEECGRCAAELDAYRALFAALSELPRFEPSPSFNDAVLARVRISPQEGALMVQLRRWLPTTTRGWVLLGAALSAPALPMIAMVVYLLTHPLVSAASVWQMSMLLAEDTLRAAGGAVMGWGLIADVTAAAQAGLAALQSIPTGMLVAGLALLAVGIPVSAWALVRLVRSPMRNVTYAN